MVTRKKKEEAATRRLNEFVEKELGKTTVFSEKEVKKEIDWMLKKGKQFYSIYQKKGETGRTTGEHEVDLDFVVVEVVCPNFVVFYERFKEHPS